MLYRSVISKIKFEWFYYKYRDNRFVKSEIEHIYHAMDKTDYSMCNIRRYIDYDKIKTDIIKKRKPSQQLSSVELCIIYESYPPQNIYKYSFVEI